MRILFHYPSRCMGRPINPHQLRTDERGLTGSEEAFFRYAQEIAARGHIVHVASKFAPFLEVGADGVHYMDDGLLVEGRIAFCDAVVSWMSPDACRGPRPDGQLRVYVEQCSDHGNTPWDWAHTVDYFLTLSRAHAEHMWPQNSMPRARYRVLPNGVEPSAEVAAKVPGRCVWASSHDRGLHHLLGVWPEVKRAVPNATLRVLYDPQGMQRFAEMPEQQVAWLENLRRRSCYQIEALERLQRMGVELVGSVSREQMQLEFAQAEVLAYPCEPVRFTETFGSTVLEAMAAGCVPVLCFADAFAELWSGACPGVYPPFEQHRGEYTKILIGVLQNRAHREADALACRKAAEAYSWDKLGVRFERFLASRGIEGLDPA